MRMRDQLEQKVGLRFSKGLMAADNKEIYQALLELTQEKLAAAPRIQGEKKLYYISAEFLVGKLLSNNLINLGIYDEVKEALAEAGKDLSAVEEVENEPSLGNGGLGRLAACYLDSAATLGLPGDGVGLLYHFGLFHQYFEDHKQVERPDAWLSPKSWLQETGTRFTVPFPQGDVEGVLYDLYVSGYDNGVNKLHLFDLATVDEGLVKQGIDFDKTDIQHNLTLFLYPDDSDRPGRLLRVYQQYFMVSCAAQLILKEMEDKGWPLTSLHEHAVIQINDTHPSMVIPELIRLLTARGLSMDEAIATVSKTCAYTNHTILAEALEKWPLDFLEEAVPGLVPVIQELDRRVKEKYPDPKVAIMDENGLVHMAHMDIHYGFSVNGVASLHTEILEKSELKAFADIYPEKFNNKTNGITFRRWLMHCNPALAAFITEKIGPGWKKDAAELEKLLQFQDDEDTLRRLVDIKHQNKKALCEELKEKAGVETDTHAIFDIQIKRLHEYKRQQMNALYIIWKYQQIKAGNKPQRPITLVFGAKAAPAYIIAKDIIHALLTLSKVIAVDPLVAPWLQVVFVENYNVTAAEKMIPACDLSEQISLASKEASGTGNMKFMLNGALTLGTMDGANVEISQQVGNENIYIFGQTSGQVIHRYAAGDYNPADWYEGDPNLRRAIDFLTGPEMLAAGKEENLARLQHELKTKDWFQTLPDFNAYVVRKGQALSDYACDPLGWRRKCLINISKAGFFSSDRTIAEYNSDIWHLGE